MQFNTSTFVFVFLPLALLAYYLVPFKRGKNNVLLAASLVFYAWGDPNNIWLLLTSIVVNYVMVLLLAQAKAAQVKKALLIITIVFDIAILSVYKYTGFVLGNISAATGLSFDIPSIVMPLGISYFTLKLVTYAVDVYRGKTPVQRNLVDLALYASMFPALTAGPIVKYETIAAQLRERTHSLRKFSSGVRLFCIGMAKKVLLSNMVALLAASILSYGGKAVGAYGAWCGLIAYAFQLYFDFSGYSDMAIGLAKMFGFDFEKNFNYPYISKSVTEFWRRWHISLSTFFREYIYIPMGGSRVNTPRFILNMATVWLLTGIWHGAAWNFIWWGLYYLAVLLFEKFVVSRVLDQLPSIVRHAYVVLVFLLGWCLFWISDTAALVEYFGALFGAYGLFGTQTYWQIGAWHYSPLFLACIVASTPVVPWIRTKFAKALGFIDSKAISRGVGIKDVSTVELCDFDDLVEQAKGAQRLWIQVVQLLCDLVLIGLLILSMVSVVSGSFSPVIYAAF